MEAFFHALPSLAFALLLSLVLGRVATRFGIPRVTVYLLVGLALGPHGFLGLVEDGGLVARLGLGATASSALDPIEQVAIGFIALGIGSEFRATAMRRAGPRLLAVSGGEILTTAVLVAAAVYAVTGDLRLTVIAPALAISTAPSATLVTLREVNSEGPVSRALLLAVGLDNLAALLLFPLLLALAFGAGHPVAATGMMIASIGGGVALGLLAAVSLEVIGGPREHVVLGLLLVLACAGLAHVLAPGSTGLAMLACFAAGVGLANGSPHVDTMMGRLETVAYPLYVLFFIGSGRDLHLESVVGLGLLGLVFVAARTAGKVGGVWLGLRMAGLEGQLPGTMGRGLLCQAGIALGFVTALEGLVPDLSADLRHVVVASVVLFELLGPWLVRHTVVGAGEVRLADLFPQAEVTTPDALRWVAAEIRRNLGLGPGEGRVTGVSPVVRNAMRRRPDVVPETMPFDEVLHLLGESPAVVLPVVDGEGEGRFRGVISFNEVKSALYSPLLRDLVIARDLTEEVPDPLSPDDGLGEALERMDREQVHSWPVVEDGRLVGVVRRTDLYGLMQRRLRERRQAGESAPTPS